MKYTLSEAIVELKLVDGKKASLPEWEPEKYMWLNKDGEVSFHNFAGLSPKEIDRDDWRVDPIKKEPVSAEEYVGGIIEKFWSQKDHLLTEREFGIKCFKAGEANNDLLYVLFIKMVSALIEKGFIHWDDNSDFEVLLRKVKKFIELKNDV